MYENITGEELKALPNEEKRVALEELMELYPDRKELSQHLGLRNNVLGILIAKHVLGTQFGGKRGSTNHVGGKKGSTNHVATEEPITNNEASNVFSTNLEAQIIGEEAKERITNIGNSLLDGKKYLVSLKVEEIEEVPTV